jgi:hypothetical protein
MDLATYNEEGKGGREVIRDEQIINDLLVPLHSNLDTVDSEN